MRINMDLSAHNQNSHLSLKGLPIQHKYDTFVKSPFKNGPQAYCRFQLYNGQSPTNFYLFCQTCHCNSWSYFQFNPHSSSLCSTKSTVTFHQLLWFQVICELVHFLTLPAPLHSPAVQKNYLCLAFPYNHCAWNLSYLTYLVHMYS